MPPRRRSPARTAAGLRTRGPGAVGPVRPSATYRPSLPGPCRAQCCPLGTDGFRSHSPLRGSPGFAPGSLLPRPPTMRGRTNCTAHRSGRAGHVVDPSRLRPAAGVTSSPACRGTTRRRRSSPTVRVAECQWSCCAVSLGPSTGRTREQVGHRSQRRCDRSRQDDAGGGMKVEHDVSASTARARTPRPLSPTATMVSMPAEVRPAAVASTTNSAHGPPVKWNRFMPVTRTPSVVRAAAATVWISPSLRARTRAVASSTSSASVSERGRGAVVVAT